MNCQEHLRKDFCCAEMKALNIRFILYWKWPMLMSFNTILCSIRFYTSFSTSLLWSRQEKIGLFLLISWCFLERRLSINYRADEFSGTFPHFLLYLSFMSCFKHGIQYRSCNYSRENVKLSFCFFCSLQNNNLPISPFTTFLKRMYSIENKIAFQMAKVYPDDL